MLVGNQAQRARLQGTTLRWAGSLWLPIGLIVAFGLIVRLVFLTRVPVFLLHDSGGYHLPAWELANGFGFELWPRRTPGYPLFLAGVIKLFGEDLFAIALVQHLIGIGIALLVWALARRLFGPVPALLAGLVVALEGTLLVSEHYVMPETLFTLVLLAAMLSLVCGLDRGGWPWFLAAGLGLGYAALVRPVGLVVLPIFLLATLLGASNPGVVVRRVALVCVGTSLLIVPWVVRNWVVLGSPSLATTMSKSLLARTARHDRGFVYYNPARAAEYMGPRESSARQIIQTAINQRLVPGEIYQRLEDRLRITEREADSLVRGLALQVIAERPVYFVQGSLAFTWDLLQGDPERLRGDWKTQNARLSRDEWDERVEHLLKKPTPAQERDFPATEALVAFVQPSYLGPLLPILAGLGALAAGRTAAGRPALVLAAAALLLILVPATLDGPVPRYRYPSDPIISALAIGSLLWVQAGVSYLRRPIGRAERPGSLYGAVSSAPES